MCFKSIKNLQASDSLPNFCEYKVNISWARLGFERKQESAVLLMRTSLEKLRQKAAAEIKRKQQQRIIQQEEVCSSGVGIKPKAAELPGEKFSAGVVEL